MPADHPSPLAGRTVALPESRELELLATMLEKRGANVVRCPLVSIHDAPEARPVLEWINRLIDGGFDDVLFFTGEGLRRLTGFADRAGKRDAFIAALHDARKVTRGPKPIKALREIGLHTDLKADEPTSDGLIATLSRENLRGRRIGLQLYGTEPNERFVDFLTAAGAQVSPVWPYIYASRAEDDRVTQLIERLAAKGIDAIAFTSMSQVQRLWKLAEARGLLQDLERGLTVTKVVSIGPVVTEELASRNVRIDAQPAGTFALKPMVDALEVMFGGKAAKG